jgi:hypothetical protein
MGSLVMGCHFKRTTGAGRSFFENQGYILSSQTGLFGSGVFCLFQIKRKFEQELDFCRGEIQKFQEAAVSEIEWHNE